VWWVILYVVLGVLSIVVLALLTLRLWRQVRQLGRDVAAAGDRVNQVMTELEQISPPRR
jgi:ABC-type transporter Mla subunit MlaD